MAWDDVSRWQPVDLAAAFAMRDPVQPVDVRDIGYREADTQIKGAIRVDPIEFEREVSGLPGDKELVFYCDRPGEATSLKIAMWAWDHGPNKRVGVLVGGWSAWVGGSHPTEPKPSPTSS
jgi:rhodanese-related sulfurtransferase